jgi:hypothetical protein
MSSHAALGVVRSGVAVLKGNNWLRIASRASADEYLGTGVRINLISAGQIEAGIDLKQV